MTYDFFPETGMPWPHFQAFRLVARDQKRIIVVRNTNPRSTPWIAQGYPPKPIAIKIRTSRTTGKVTAANAVEIQQAQRAGFYVLDSDGVARNAQGQALPEKFPLHTPEQNEPGQVLHPTQKKALVGDYDLMAVIDPAATGRNIVLATVDGVPVADRMNPEAQRAADAINLRLDQPRVMHGAHDQFADIPDCGNTVFWPDGRAELLRDRAATEDFYRKLRRQTITGSYPQP